MAMMGTAERHRSGLCAAIIAALLAVAFVIASAPHPASADPAEEAPPAAIVAPAEPQDTTLGVAALPEVGANGLPADWARRASLLMVQALGGVGSAFFLIAATHWLGRRRARG